MQQAENSHAIQFGARSGKSALGNSWASLSSTCPSPRRDSFQPRYHPFRPGYHYPVMLVADRSHKPHIYSFPLFRRRLRNWIYRSTTIFGTSSKQLNLRSRSMGFTRLDHWNSIKPLHVKKYPPSSSLNNVSLQKPLIDLHIRTSKPSILQLNI